MPHVETNLTIQQQYFGINNIASKSICFEQVENCKPLHIFGARQCNVQLIVTKARLDQIQINNREQLILRLIDSYREAYTNRKLFAYKNSRIVNYSC